MKSITTSVILYYLFLFASCPLAIAETPARVVADYLTQARFKGELRWWKPDERLTEFDQGLQCYLAKHVYLWYKNRFTIQLDGSGRIFQLGSNDSMVRIDNTCYEGYNFGAYNFVYQDTLFSLGGYGYWQVNNQLRFYDQRIGEWAVIPTNKIFPFQLKLLSHVYLDTPRHQLYVVYLDLGSSQLHTTAPYQKKLYVQCLDLDTKKWWEHEKAFIFRQDQNFDVTYWLLREGIPIRQGLLLVMQNEALVLDFAHNRGYSLDTYTHQNIMSLVGTLSNWLIICEPSGPTFFNPVNLKMHPILIPDKSLKPLPDKLYTETVITSTDPYVNTSNYWITTGLLCTAFLFSLYYNYSLRNRLRHFMVAEPGEDPQPTNGLERLEMPKPIFRDNLTETENAVLEVLLTNAAKEEKTTVTEINHALGLTKKTTRVQNNIRAATLLMINKKFMVYSGTKDELIQKERTEFDKRIYEYFILKKYLSKIRGGTK